MYNFICILYGNLFYTFQCTHCKYQLLNAYIWFVYFFISELTFLSSLRSLVVQWGRVLEKSDLWMYIKPYLLSSYSSMGIYNGIYSILNGKPIFVLKIIFFIILFFTILYSQSILDQSPGHRWHCGRICTSSIGLYSHQQNCKTPANITDVETHNHRSD